MEKRFIIRHKILKVLQSVGPLIDEMPADFSIGDVTMSIRNIALKSGMSEEHVRGQLLYLIQQGEIERFDEGGQVEFYITDKGRINYENDTYLGYGRNSSSKRLEQGTKSYIPYLMAGLAIVTVILNLYVTLKSNNDVVVLKRKIEKLEQIDSLRSNRQILNK